MTGTTLLCFLGASMLLTLAPGPDNLFILAQGITHGRRTAVLTAWGMCSGVTLHTLAAAGGISALLCASATAFQLVKFAGAAYLLLLAFKTWRAASDTPDATSPPAGPTGRRAFMRGFLMNVLNPKVALFFLAFLPQFVDPQHGSTGRQMTLLGLLFMLQGLVLFTAIAFAAGALGRLLARRPRVARTLHRLSAGLFAALGLRLALAHT